MLLDLNCDHETMKHTYETLTPLLNEADVDASYRFEAGMVFEGSCGNFNIALEHAQALVEKRRQSEGIAHLMRALTNAAVAARIAGAITRATEWLNEALAIAKAHRLPLATEVPMQILASIALDAGDPDAARGWYSELIALPESRYDASRRIVSDSIGLRLALHDGNVKLARELVHADLPELLSDPVAYRRTYGLALLVAVELVEDATLQVEAVSALETSHLVCRRCSGQAFATFVLVSALRRLGRPSRADQLLQEYLQVHRREPTPAPMYLLTLTASAVQLARAGDAEATFLRSWPAIAGTNGTS
jgi:tetratricopeptide (TPR) repeat protein